MNLIKKTSLALGLLAVASTSFAQTATTTSSNGLLGQSYYELNYNLADIDGVGDHFHGATVALNVPVLPSLLDVGGSYTYSWFKGPARGHGNTFAAYANAYVPLEGAKPFVGASVNYSWVSLPLDLGDHDGAWDLTAGVEVPFGSFVFTPKITYSDDFNGKIGNSDDSWTYAIEGHYWFSPKAGAFATVAKIDNHRDPVDIWSYTVGLRFRF
jgi:hypothetical protein